MKKVVLLAMSALVMIPGGVVAKDKDAAADDGSAATPAKKICRTDPMTGSRTRSSRICHTQAEWDAIADEANKNIRDRVASSTRTDRQTANPSLGQGF